MTIFQIRDFLMWCTVINVGLLILSFLFMCTARQWVYKMHSKWFPMTEGQFNTIFYSLLGVYKILIILFNVIPWIAVCIVAP